MYPLGRRCVGSLNFAFDFGTAGYCLSSLSFFPDTSLAGKKGSTWMAGRFTLTTVSRRCYGHVDGDEGNSDVAVKAVSSYSSSRQPGVMWRGRCQRLSALVRYCPCPAFAWSSHPSLTLWPINFFFFLVAKFFFSDWRPLDFCAFNKYTLVIENKMRSNDQVRNLWNEECLKQPSRFLKLCLQGSHGKMPALTYFLFTACFPAPSTLIHTQFFSWNCSTFAADICSSSCE